MTDPEIHNKANNTVPHIKTRYVFIKFGEYEKVDNVQNPTSVSVNILPSVFQPVVFKMLPFLKLWFGFTVEREGCEEIMRQKYTYMVN